MKKALLISTVLGLGALGMACGEPANTNTTKPNTNVAPIASPAAMPSPAASAPATSGTPVKAPAGTPPKMTSASPMASPKK